MYKVNYDLTTGLTEEKPLTETELAEKEQNFVFGLELAKTKYQRDRAAEYPPIGDQLDALWKGGNAAIEMLAQVQSVKTKYPKP